MRRHCLVHSVGVASLITDCIERDGLQRLGIVTAGFRIESKRKHKKKAKKEKAGQAATRFDEHVGLTLASPRKSLEARRDKKFYFLASLCLQ